MRRRLESILQRKPMSRYALTRLWRIHRGAAAKKRLLLRAARRWRKLQARAAKAKQKRHRQRLTTSAFAARLVLARLYALSGSHEQAVPHLKAVLQRRKGWSGPQRLLLRCYLAAPGQHKAAIMPLFHQVWMTTRSRKGRSELLKKALVSAFSARASSLVTSLKPYLSTHRWSVSARAALARQWLKAGYVDEGLSWLAKASSKARGELGWRLRVEHLQGLIKHRRDNAALALIATLRKRSKRPAWSREALLVAEIKLHRRSGRLYTFLLKLQQRWFGQGQSGGKRLYARLVRLAKLYASIQAQEAIVLFRQALRIKPSAKEPRLYLIQHFFKAGRQRKAFGEMERLIHFGRAAPTHMLEWSRYILRTELDRPKLTAWKLAWKKRPICRRLKHKPKVMPQRPTRCFHRPSCRRWIQCHRGLWTKLRVAIWRDWEGRATTKEKALFGRVTKVLTDLLARYPRHWNDVFVAHRMLVDLGEAKATHRAYRLLRRFVQPNAAQLAALAKLMKTMGQGTQQRQLFHRMLRSRPISALHHLQVIELAWKQLARPARLCGTIHGAIRRVMRTAPKGFVKKHFGQALRLLAVGWRCRERSRISQRWLRQAMAVAAKSPTKQLALLNAAMSERAAGPLAQCLSQPMEHRQQQKLARAWAQSWADPALDNKGIEWLRRISRRIFARNPWPLYHWYLSLCRRRGVCQNERSSVIAILTNKRFSVVQRARLLLRAHQSKVVRRDRWLRRLLKSPGLTPDRRLLIRYGAVFRGPGAFGGVHLRLMKAHFKRLIRRLPSADASLWSEHLHHYLSRPALQPKACGIGRRLFHARAIGKVAASLPIDQSPKLLGGLVRICSQRGEIKRPFFARLRRRLPRGKISELFKFYVEHRISSALGQMLRHPQRQVRGASKARVQQAWTKQLLTRLDAGSRQAFVTDTLQRCFHKIDRVPASLPAVLTRVCQADGRLCQGLFRCFYAVMHSKNVQPSQLMSLLATAQRQLSHTARYAAFVTRLIEYWKDTLLSEGWMKERDFAALATMALRQELFQSSDATLAARLGNAHFGLLLYVLERRTTLPEDATRWLQLLQKLLKDDRPHAQRRVALLKQSADRSMVVNAMRLWLSPKGKRVVARLRKLRNARQLPASLHALSPWLLGPIYKLFRYPATIEGLWRKWLERHPKQASKRAIARWNKRCCLDAVDRRMALRLMKWGLHAFGAREMRIEILRIQPKLTTPQRKSLYRALGGYRTYFQQRLKIRSSR